VNFLLLLQKAKDIPHSDTTLLLTRPLHHPQVGRSTCLHKIFFPFGPKNVKDSFDSFRESSLPTDSLRLNSPFCTRRIITLRLREFTIDFEDLESPRPDVSTTLTFSLHYQGLALSRLRSSRHQPLGVPTSDTRCAEMPRLAISLPRDFSTHEVE
jgi:hypothetical protein